MRHGVGRSAEPRFAFRQRRRAVRDAPLQGAVQADERLVGLFEAERGGLQLLHRHPQALGRGGARLVPRGGSRFRVRESRAQGRHLGVAAIQLGPGLAERFGQGVALPRRRRGRSRCVRGGGKGLLDPLRELRLKRVIRSELVQIARFRFHATLCLWRPASD